MKKLLALLLAVLTVFSLAACSSDEDDDRNDDDKKKDKGTVAALVGKHKLDSVELNYYYIDAIDKFYAQWEASCGESTEAYLQAIFGVDIQAPLAQQLYDAETEITWADYFLKGALCQAQHEYAMYDLAMEAGFQLPEEQKASLDQMENNLNSLFGIYGYSNVDAFLAAVYGSGATLKSYKAYYERTLIASAYYTAYADSIVYTEDEREAYQADKKTQYNSYSYSYCYISETTFLGEGAKDESGEVVYTEEQKEYAHQMMSQYAAELAGTVKTTDELREKLWSAPLPSGKFLYVQEEMNHLYKDIEPDALREWLGAEDRKAGDIAAIPDVVKATDSEAEQVTGYYVVIFDGTCDNTDPMADMGYLFIPYQGGMEDQTTGEMTYSDASIAEARATAEGYLQQWHRGEKTVASFEALAEQLLTEEKIPDGGLLNNVNADSEWSAEILEWALDGRRHGLDSTIVQSDDGFYVLLYVTKSRLNYRQYLIETDMREADCEAWYNEALAKTPAELKDVSTVDKEITMMDGYGTTTILNFNLPEKPDGDLVASIPEDSTPIIHIKPAFQHTSGCDPIAE